MLDNDFKIANTLACETVDINMTCLQGKVTTTYDNLCKVFGYPTMTDGDPYEKVNAQWELSLQFLLQMTLELKISMMWLQQSTIGKLDISLLKNMNGTLVVSVKTLLIVFTRNLTWLRNACNMDPHNVQVNIGNNFRGNIGFILPPNTNYNTRCCM